MTPDQFRDAVMSLAEEMSDLVRLNINRLANDNMDPVEVLQRLSSIANNAECDAARLMRQAPKTAHDGEVKS